MIFQFFRLKVRSTSWWTPQTASQEGSSCGILLEVKQRENMLRGLDICETGVWRNILQMLNDSELMEHRLVRGDKAFGQSLERHTL